MWPKREKAGASGITAKELVQGMRPYKGESDEAFLRRATDAVAQLEANAHGGVKPDAAALAAAEAKVRAILKEGADGADRRD